MKQKVMKLMWVLGLSLVLVNTPVFAQSVNAKKIVPVITFLLSGDDCIKPLVVGDVVFDTLDSKCADQVIQGTGLVVTGQYASYYSFTHPGGPLHIDLISDFPNSYDAYLALRHGEGRDGDLVEDGGAILGDTNGFDDDGHEDYHSSRLIYLSLPAGRYTIEATSYDVAEGSYNLSVYGSKVTAKATGKLNDTSIKFTGKNDTENHPHCSTVDLGFVKQDCELGRDADSIIGFHNPNDGDGDSGFSFLKVSSTGAPLVASETDWSCVKDNVTGLMWEVKTDDNGLHDKDDTYNWYNTDTKANGGATGPENDDGAICSGYNVSNSATFCNTQAFVARVNAAGLCGYNDWRMPTVTELQSIVSYQTIDYINPTIDESFFPNTQLWFFWSASPGAGGSSDAWGVGFVSGVTAFSSRSGGRAVRLVRGGQ